jgi:hypothetical protein
MSPELLPAGWGLAALQRRPAFSFFPFFSFWLKRSRPYGAWKKHACFVFPSFLARVYDQLDTPFSA